MLPLHVGRAEIDFCRNGCKGLWFDHQELQCVDAEFKEFSDALNEALAAPHRIGHHGPIRCPRCAKPMHHQSYRQSGVFVDACYICGGYFLAAGELQQIREFSGTAKARELARARKELMTYKSPPIYEFMRKDLDGF